MVCFQSVSDFTTLGITLGGGGESTEEAGTPIASGQGQDDASIWIGQSMEYTCVYLRTSMTNMRKFTIENFGNIIMASSMGDALMDGEILTESTSNITLNFTTNTGNFSVGSSKSDSIANGWIGTMKIAFVAKGMTNDEMKKLYDMIVQLKQL